MTADLRAALREALNLSQHQDFNARHAAYMRLVEISIAPPTVAESDAAKWRRVEPLIKRLCAFEDGPTDLRDLLTVALDVLAATKDPS